MLHNESQQRIKEIEGELAKLRAVLVEVDIAKLRAVLVEVDMAKNNVVEQLREKNKELQGFEEVVARQAAELDTLKTKIVALKKVML